MCGIVGYLGEKNTVDVLINGLKRLEYRGYDSSGVAVFEKNDFKVLRAQGKLSQLEEKIKTAKPFVGPVGIAHTRWATHGVPSEKNAHPHKIDGVCLVHNGIIENYSELKQELIAEGAKFLSDTDSEVVAHLIARELKKTPHLRKAVHRVIALIEGAYAILVVWDQQPDTIVAFKNGPPLIVGVGQKEMFVGSDVQAMLQYTKSMVYLEDHEVAEMTAFGVHFYNKNGDGIQKTISHVEWNSAQAEKMGFKHYMLKEIFEQPKAVASVLEKYINHETLSVCFDEVGVSPLPSAQKNLTQQDLQTIDRIFIIACGTSFYASMYAEYLIEKLAGVPVEVDVASEFRYRDPVIPKNSLVMVISQSGETADTLAVLRMAKERGALTLSLSNTKGSTIDREAHGHLYMHAGIEIGVASTKAFISTLTVVNLFAIYLARLRSVLSAVEEKSYVQNLLALPSQMEAVLSYDKYFAKAANVFKDYRGFLYLGRGINYPIAMEGALKLKELAYMHAEGYAAGEMKHGPLALIDSSILVLVICPKDVHYEKTLSNLQEAKARGGVIISIGTGEDHKLKDMSREYLSLPKSDWMASGILSVIPVQLLAYHVANVMGYDVDQPRNLAKSVTVE
jgi:glutamine---fructose-6-phosphate transaminase (isomerizing)